MRIGGIISQHQNGTLKLLGTIKNSGNLNYAGKQAGAIGTSVGGIFGGNDSAGSISADSYAVILNEGRVAFTGETVQQFYIGGIAAFCSKYAIPATVKLINTGDLVATGKSGEGLAKNCIVSGIIGSLKYPIDGAQCFCNINAPKYTAQTGMLEGKARTTAQLYTNAKVGGTICRSTEEKEDSEGTKKPTPIVETLSAENFMVYIYGVATTWAEGSTYDGCTYISSKDEIDYSPVVVTPAE
jgi:tetrahydromethanopterin S-methyltransferase subunit D